MHWYPQSLSLITLLSLSLADAVRIDDFDSTVQYNGPWTDGLEIPDDRSQNWESTLHYSNISGATTTVKFTGTSISVFGSFHPPGKYNMQSLYSVDDQKPFVFYPAHEVPVSTHQTLFYSSPQLPYGQHTLVVTNLGEQLFLDFFDVHDETIPTSPSTTHAASIAPSAISTETSTSSLGTIQTATVTPTNPAEASDPSRTSDSQKISVSSQFTFITGTSLAVATATPPSGSLPPTTRIARPSTSTAAGESVTTPIGAAQSPTERPSRGLSKGAIAGIAVGSVIIAAALSAGLWWYWRSRERTWLVTDLHFEPEKMSVPDPNFRGHRPTLPKLGLGSDTSGSHRASAPVHRRSASMPSSSVHLIGYSSSTPSTCSG